MTSSCETVPSGPVGVTVARSTPRSLASLRTEGLASARTSDTAGGATANVFSAVLRGSRVDFSSRGPDPTRVAWVAGSSAGTAPAPASFGSSVAAPTPSSIAISAVPTSTVWPAGTRRCATTPAYGLGSSTRDFAVSISTTGVFTATVSPTATSQVTTVASVSPSPTSGRV